MHIQAEQSEQSMQKHIILGSRPRRPVGDSESEREAEKLERRCTNNMGALRHVCGRANQWQRSVFQENAKSASPRRCMSLRKSGKCFSKDELSLETKKAAIGAGVTKCHTREYKSFLTP